MHLLCIKAGTKTPKKTTNFCVFVVCSDLTKIFVVFLLEKERKGVPELRKQFLRITQH